MNQEINNEIKVKDDWIGNHLERKEVRYAIIITQLCNGALFHQKPLNEEEVLTGVQKYANDIGKNITMEEVKDALHLFFLAGGASRYQYADKPTAYRPTMKENYHGGHPSP